MDSHYKKYNDGWRDGTKNDKKVLHLRPILKNEANQEINEAMNDRNRQEYFYNFLYNGNHDLLKNRHFVIIEYCGIIQSQIPEDITSYELRKWCDDYEEIRRGEVTVVIYFFENHYECRDETQTENSKD